MTQPLTHHHGWPLGYFKPDGDLRRTGAFEVKWGRHRAGESRSEWVRGDDRLTVMVLISGRFGLTFERGSDAQQVVLEKPGAYVVWEGVDHTWQALEDTVIVTVRSPSISGYQAAAIRSQGR